MSITQSVAASYRVGMAQNGITEREILVDPASVAITLGLVAHARNDPTCGFSTEGWWRATLTPDGPAAINVRRLDATHVAVRCVGTGADWLGNTCEHLLGLHDRRSHVVASHDAVREAMRTHAHVRIPTTLTPYHELLPATIAQRVTGMEAARQWHMLCRRYGTHVEGSPEGLFSPPDTASLLEVPHHELHRLGIEQSRARTLHAIARHFHTRRICASPADVEDRHTCTGDLQKIRGVGPWTAAVAGFLAFGDADALAIGDFHHKNTVAYALTGAHRGSDDEMMELMECYRPDRARVLLWLQRDGWRAPAHGPRRRIVDIASL